MRRAPRRAHLLALDAGIGAEKDPVWRQRLVAVRARVERDVPEVRRIGFVIAGFADAQQASVAGDFNGWDPQRSPLRRAGRRWTETLDLDVGVHEYKFVVDGRWITDPASTATAGDAQAANSVLSVR